MTEKKDMTQERSAAQSLLIIEDDPGLQNQLKWCFDGYDVHTASDRSSAIAALRRYEPQVITLDLGLPPDPTNASEGLLALEEILALAPHTKIIVVTGNDDKENAIRAVAMGAYDFYQKPIDAEILQIIVDRAFHLHELEIAYQNLSRVKDESPLEGLITGDEQMLAICKKIEKLAPTNATTLIIGESGTGKEILANAIHQLSGHSEGKFVAINCAAIPDTLLESELFGYEKGAFTGATKQTKGKIESANNGTLFLDEIGDLTGSLQAKLLRFLQERKIERLGGREEILLDVRVVSATHQDLQDMMKEGKFREDLFYRLSEITINLPPLRERKGDITLLAKAFFNKHRTDATTAKTFSQNALLSMENYSWPGNVRELENRVKRALIMAEGAQISSEDVELEDVGNNTDQLNLKTIREKAEKDIIGQVLATTNNNIAKSAELLGVSRPTLYDLLSKYGLK